MKKKTFIRVPLFVWALLAILLVSSTIGTPVWAKNPKNPGKPSPQPETFTYQIWIGIGDQDLVLEEYVRDELGKIDYLLVEDVGYSGRWLPPPKRGKYTSDSWIIGLVSVNLDGEPLDYCGTYEINHEEVADILDIASGTEAYMFYLEHTAQKRPVAGKEDYWLLGIVWQVGTWPTDPETPHYHVLMGYTDVGLDAEGEYDENTDTWTITFENAAVWENSESGDFDVLWDDPFYFTVKVKRSPYESE